MYKYVFVSLFFTVGLLADSLSLRYSPKDFDYIFSSNPSSIGEIPFVSEMMKKKYEEHTKSSWCKEAGINMENMNSFAFTANLKKFLSLKKVRTSDAQLERIQQWLMFIEYKTAPNLAMMTQKYEEKKAAGTNRLNFEKSEIAGKTVYLVPFKQRTYCYAQLSDTKWVAGEKETVAKALDLNEEDSMMSKDIFVEEMAQHGSALMFSVHNPEGTVEIAHPSFKSYNGHFSKLTYSDDFVYDFNLSMGDQQDLQGVESFVRMMSSFILAKPELNMSAENLITSVTEGNLDISIRASAENIKSMMEHMKNKWMKKRAYKGKSSCATKKCDQEEAVLQ